MELLNSDTVFAADLKDKLPEFLTTLEKTLRASTDCTAQEEDLLRTYMGEVRVGLDLIAPHLKQDMRVLEVGSGIGALGHFLTANGVNIIGIEPGGTGFDVMTKLSGYVRKALSSDVKFTCKTKGCEDLSVREDGQFDLIYSVHVLEHLPDLKVAMTKMQSVMKPNGMMLHLCPNYRFPYDPHFSIPIIFWSPKFTRIAFSRRISKDVSLWESLNFISSGELNHLAKAHNMTTRFEKGVMARFFSRLLTDPIFGERHTGLASKIAIFIARTPLIKILQYCPASWVSPMSVKMMNYDD